MKLINIINKMTMEEKAWIAGTTILIIIWGFQDLRNNQHASIGDSIIIISACMASLLLLVYLCAFIWELFCRVAGKHAKSIVLWALWLVGSWGYYFYSKSNGYGDLLEFAALWIAVIASALLLLFAVMCFWYKFPTVFWCLVCAVLYLYLRPIDIIGVIVFFACMVLYILWALSKSIDRISHPEKNNN